MEKPWLSSYPSGVPTNIDPGVYHSIVDLLEQSCHQFKDRVAFHNMGAEISYAELDYLTRNFAASLQEMGLQPGDRLALMMPKLSSRNYRRVAYWKPISMISLSYRCKYFWRLVCCPMNQRS